MSEANWLVKSSGRILGPFQLDEVIHHLQARSLSILDEVRDPHCRWTFVRECQALSEVVRQIRSEDEERSDATQTTFVGTKTKTETVTDVLLHDELTPVPNLSQASGSIQGGARPISAVERAVSDSALDKFSYGALGDPRIQRSLQKRTQIGRLLAGGLFLVAVGLGGFALHSFHRTKQELLDRGQANLRQAKDFIALGQNEKALQHLDEAAKQIVFGDAEKLLLAQLRLQVEGKSLEALRVLKEVSDQGQQQFSRAYRLTKAMAQIHEKRWSEALSELQFVLEGNPDDPEALINSAVLDLERGLPALALVAVERLEKAKVHLGEAALLRGLAVLETVGTNGRQQRYELAVHALEKNLEVDFELFLEKVIVLAALENQMGRANGVLAAVSRLWKVDPFDSRNFSFSLLTTLIYARWEKLLPLCQQIVAGSPMTEGSEALNAICLFGKGNTSGALQAIETARKRLSESALLAAVQALIFIRTDRKDDARAPLALAQTITMGRVAQAELCQVDQDWVCAQKMWLESLMDSLPEGTALEDQRKGLGNPLFLHGHAQALKQLGSELAAHEEMRSAFRNSPRYRPLLEVGGDYEK